MRKILIILANGFEEIEAVSVIDILRRASFDVVVAGLSGLDVTGAHGLRVRADQLVSECDIDMLDGIVLPGGEPGTSNLEKSTVVRDLILQGHNKKKLIAAICVAPRILDALGLLNGRPATSFPGTKPDMTHCIYHEENVVESGPIITSRGAGTAMLFAYHIVAYFNGEDESNVLKEAMVFS